MIDQIKKRDGRIVPFDKRRIADAIYKAGKAQIPPKSIVSIV